MKTKQPKQSGNKKPQHKPVTKPPAKSGRKKPTPAPEKSKRGKGRPKRDIDLALVESLGEIQCTYDECASVLKIPKSTLSSRPDFSDAFKRGLENGKISLRRLQFHHAKKSYAMCIWLGKQYLDQSDKNKLAVDATSFDQIKQQIETVYIGHPLPPANLTPVQTSPAIIRTPPDTN